MNKITFTKYVDDLNHKSFYLKNDNKQFIISFQGNLDLYFSLVNFDKEPYFIINKSNNILYQLFDKLYNDVKNCNIFDNDELNRNYIYRSEYKKLFNNDIIEWKSDDYPDEIAQSFRIIKYEDKFKIEFSPLITDKNIDYYIEPQLKNWISVRIRNSGSKYDPFNIVFMKLYNALCDYEEIDINQINIEEYLYNKKKTLIKDKL